MTRNALPYLTFFTLCFGAMSCTESEIELKEQLEHHADYRAAFEGSFAGTRMCSYGHSGDSTSFAKMEDTLVVRVNWESIDSIWINNWQVPVNEDGYYSGYNEVGAYNTFIAEFRKDSLVVKTTDSALNSGTVCKWETIRQR